ncbi:UNVERIFIED_CONTAM: hypothetical protein Sangu_0395200 [Sesamum angustifolium]|uniref:Retrotransposon gag domain-containing protein n=1 Tax=Sesamum angustifolium TaxID=2727405 RepID=A0AAW2QSF8_9LAMI
MGAPVEERASIPFMEGVMADELPMNYRTPAIAEYDGTTDPQEHLSRFENAILLHRYTNGIKCRVSVTTFARATQQWFNQLPPTVIGSFEEFRSLFLHQFGSTALEVPTTTCARIAGQRLFKSLAKKQATKFDALLARAAKYINMDDAQASKREGRGEKWKEIRMRDPPKAKDILQG